MNDASNSDNGIGSTLEETASRISSILDSESTATPDTNDAENETDEVSQPTDEDDESSPEQVDETSEEQVDDDSDEAVETVDPKVVKLADDLTVDIDGEKLTAKQLREERLRYADYTRKTQALAEEGKKYASNQYSVDEIRNQSMRYLYDLEQNIAAHLPQQPNWQQLLADDPVEFQRQQFEWQARNAQIQNLRNERLAVEKQANERKEALHQQALVEGQKALHELHPELAKQETGKAVELGNYLVKSGIPADAIARETNPVLFSMAYKAMQFDQLQNQKAKAVKVVDAKPPLTTPGSSPARSASGQAAYEKKMGQLKRDGSIESLAAVLKHRI